MSVILLSDARRAIAELGLFAAFAFLVALGLAYLGATQLTRGVHEIYKGIDPVTERRRNGQANAFLGRIMQRCV